MDWLLVKKQIRNSLTAVNQSKIFKVGKLGNNSTFFDFSEKCENLKNSRDFWIRLFRDERKYEKTQENRCDCLNWRNLKIPLHFWKKVLLFFRFTAQLENPKKLELFCVFWWFKKVKSWILGFLCFLNSEFCRIVIVELREPTTDFRRISPYRHDRALIICLT